MESFTTRKGVFSNLKVDLRNSIDFTLLKLSSHIHRTQEQKKMELEEHFRDREAHLRLAQNEFLGVIVRQKEQEGRDRARYQRLQELVR